jgi:hypothetical protein
MPAGHDGTIEKEPVDQDDPMVKVHSADEPDSDVKIPNPTSEGPETSPLESYLLQADKDLDGTVFFRQDGVELPQLRIGNPNSVIVFPGCFNPPHRAHLELICNAFYSTDDCTIAAMNVLGNDD